MLLIVKYYKKIVLSPKKTSLYNLFLVSLSINSFSFTLYLYILKQRRQCATPRFYDYRFLIVKMAAEQLFIFCLLCFFSVRQIFSLSIFFLTGYAWKNLWTYQFYICRYIYPIYPIYPRQRRIQKNRNL